MPSHTIDNDNYRSFKAIMRWSQGGVTFPEKCSLVKNTTSSSPFSSRLQTTKPLLPKQTFHDQLLDHETSFTPTGASDCSRAPVKNEAKLDFRCFRTLLYWTQVTSIVYWSRVAVLKISRQKVVQSEPVPHPSSRPSVRDCCPAMARGHQNKRLSWMRYYQ